MGMARKEKVSVSIDTCSSFFFSADVWCDEKACLWPNHLQSIEGDICPENDVWCNEKTCLWLNFQSTESDICPEDDVWHDEKACLWQNLQSIKGDIFPKERQRMSKSCGHTGTISSQFLKFPCYVWNIYRCWKSVVQYRWQELPQVSFLLRQKFCHDKRVCWDKHVFVTTKQVFCCNKSMLVTTKFSSWRTRVCRDKHNFVTTDKVFVSTKTFVVASILLLQQKTCLSKQNFCCDRNDTCGSSRLW